MIHPMYFHLLVVLLSNNFPNFCLVLISLPIVVITLLYVLVIVMKDLHLLFSHDPLHFSLLHFLHKPLAIHRISLEELFLLLLLLFSLNRLLFYLLCTMSKILLLIMLLHLLLKLLLLLSNIFIIWAFFILC